MSQTDPIRDVIVTLAGAWADYTLDRRTDEATFIVGLEEQVRKAAETIAGMTDEDVFRVVDESAAPGVPAAEAAPAAAPEPEPEKQTAAAPSVVPF